jgi:hypothetical protein
LPICESSPHTLYIFATLLPSAISLSWLPPGVKAVPANPKAYRNIEIAVPSLMEASPAARLFIETAQQLFGHHSWLEELDWQSSARQLSERLNIAVKKHSAVIVSTAKGVSGILTLQFTKQPKHGQVKIAFATAKNPWYIIKGFLIMEPRGIEPLTSSLPAMRSPSWAKAP